jgi:hypothetical protein
VSKEAKSFITHFVVWCAKIQPNIALVAIEVKLSPSNDLLLVLAPYPLDFGTFRRPFFIEAPRTKFMQYSA